MKKKILSALCTCASLITLYTQTGLVRQATPHVEQGIASFHYMNNISKTDFRNAGQTTLLKTMTITSPGVYCFVQDISSVQAGGTPGTEGNAAALYINTSNVTVDFAGKALKYGGSTNQVKGVEVANSKHNISIKGGNILDFTGEGILINHSCNNIRIKDMTITGTRQGIYLKGSSTSGQDISEVVIENCSSSGMQGVSGSQDAVGMQMDYTWNVVVDNCIFSRNKMAGIHDEWDGLGVFLQSCTNVLFNNCDASGNEGSLAHGFYVKGDGTNNCSGVMFINCTANNNFAIPTAGEFFSEGGVAYGFRLEYIDALYMKNCTASNNEGLLESYGLYLENCTGSQMYDCNAYNTTSALDGSISRGFHLSSNIGSYLKNCLATGTRSGGASASVYGFYIASESYSSLSDCIAHSNGNTTEAATTAGFYIDSNGSSRDIIFRNCRASNNLSSGTAYGFYEPHDGGVMVGGSTSLLVNCIAFGNKNTSNTHNNYSFTYDSAGEAVDETSEVTSGGLSGITTLRPYQNVTIKAN